MAVALVPMLQCARLREQAGLPRRPVRGGLAQVHPLRCMQGQGAGVGEEPGLAIAQAQEGAGAGTATEFGAACAAQGAGVVGEGAAVFIQHDHAGPWPKCLQGGVVLAQMVGAVKRAIDEREGRAGPVHTVNDDPHPQVVFAFGLRITNWAPLSDSL